MCRNFLHWQTKLPPTRKQKYTSIPVLTEGSFIMGLNKILQSTQWPTQSHIYESYGKCASFTPTRSSFRDSSQSWEVSVWGQSRGSNRSRSGSVSLVQSVWRYIMKVSGLVALFISSEPSVCYYVQQPALFSIAGVYFCPDDALNNKLNALRSFSLPIENNTDIASNFNCILAENV